VTTSASDMPHTSSKGDALIYSARAPYFTYNSAIRNCLFVDGKNVGRYLEGKHDQRRAATASQW